MARGRKVDVTCTLSVTITKETAIVAANRTLVKLLTSASIRPN